MVAVDTNVIVRFFTGDDPLQSPIAAKLIEGTARKGETIFISTLVLAEIIWVLESAYHFSRSDIASVITDLLETQYFHLEVHECVEQSLASFQKGKADFSDYLIAAIAQKRGHSKLHTFDSGCSEKDLFIQMTR